MYAKHVHLKYIILHVVFARRLTETLMSFIIVVDQGTLSLLPRYLYYCHQVVDRDPYVSVVRLLTEILMLLFPGC